MSEKISKAELERIFESLENKGSVIELAEILRAFYPDEEIDPRTGHINLIGRRESWKLGVRLSEGLKIGFAHGFWPLLGKVGISYEAAKAMISESLEPNQEIRWQRFEEYSESMDQQPRITNGDNMELNREGRENSEKEIQRRLEKLFMCSGTERYAILYKWNLDEDLIASLVLQDNSPKEAARELIGALKRRSMLEIIFDKVLMTPLPPGIPDLK